MHQVKPGMVFQGRLRTPRPTLLVLAVLMTLWAVGSLVGLANELLSGAEATFDYGTGDVPWWAFWVVSSLLASYAAWDTWTAWRMTGPDHGVLDQSLEPTGIRVIRPRTWGRAHQVLVERGQTLTIDATLAFRRRNERHYAFTVSAPGGTFRFTQPVHVEKLSLAPLDESARSLGITVVTTGDAQRIERARRRR